ncbi:MAG TPA: cysteine desulfurase family protein [Thermomicrobiales bacterium]|nr:cysteine desulfurase family protein [Thermomicrobiales bacterium]
MRETDIYLDHAATTPVDPRVLEVMLPFFNERFGNPSSIYTLGQDARAGLDWARGTMAGLLGCRARELVMTSGATESNNLAIKGVAWWHRFNAPERGNHIVVSAIEHHAVLHAAEALVPHGFEVSLVEPDRDGLVQPEAVEAALRPDTCLVSVMYANNEIGTIQPIREIAAMAHERGITVHTDAVQAAGALPLDVDDLGVDLLSLSAHKFYGPKGTGLLYVRRRTPIEWQQHGGGQEGGSRGGTENVPLLVGMAAALALATDEQDERTAKLTRLRDRLIDGILERVPDSRLNGHPQQRLPNNVNLSFAGVEGETLLLNLDMLGIAASSGSACSTGSTEPSHVLTALGLGPEIARGSLRLTLGKDTTDAEIDRATEAVVETVERVRQLAASPA